MVGKRRFEHCIGGDWNEGSREREDLMAEVKDKALLQIVENQFSCVAATRPNTALAL